ncbi:MAG: dicarboxylate/amino acid:cation symporter, partial [Muribaculaceae bacterium]|nr:dicarboxylate/amino acid:cation symporter [Muribaculaceae bacterium]
MKTKFHLGLLPRVLIAIALGVGVGFISPLWLARIFATFNSIFSEFLGFIIPLLIVGFVAPAIFEIGRNAGRMLVVTALIAYAMTFASGAMSYYISDLTFPSMIKPDAYVAAQESAEPIAPYFTVAIDPLMNVMTALVLAFVLGLCLSR